MKITIEEMLVERDIISRQQLERVKEIQKSHEDKSLTICCFFWDIQQKM